jgi:hypothetical protein
MEIPVFASLAAHPWAYPALEVVHLIGVALILGNLVLLECRVLGVAPSLPLVPLAQLSSALAVIGFLFAAASGLLMFATQAGELLANRVFTLKMLGLMLAGGNAAWFHGRGSLTRLDAIAKLQIVMSSLIWIAVIALGRWLAYS